MQSLNILAGFLLTLTFPAKQSINKPSSSWAEQANIKAAVTEMPIKDTLSVPPHYKKLAEAKGDFDKDSQDEWVIVYDTEKKIDDGTERQIFIYKKLDNNWKLWHKSTGAVLPSEHGGMMGDPFEGISVQKGTLVVQHMGGGSEKWSYTHRYRYQNNNWFLIGATIHSGSPCNHFDTYDYNLSTGQINAAVETQTCKGEEDKNSKTKTEKFSFVSKPAKPVRMDGFYPGNNEVKIKGKMDSFYF